MMNAGYNSSARTIGRMCRVCKIFCPLLSRQLSLKCGFATNTSKMEVCGLNWYVLAIQPAIPNILSLLIYCFQLHHTRWLLSFHCVCIQCNQFIDRFSCVHSIKTLKFDLNGWFLPDFRHSHAWFGSVSVAIVNVYFIDRVHIHSFVFISNSSEKAC